MNTQRGCQLRPTAGDIRMRSSNSATNYPQQRSSIGENPATQQGPVAQYLASEKHQAAGGRPKSKLQKPQMPRNYQYHPNTKQNPSSEQGLHYPVSKENVCQCGKTIRRKDNLKRHWKTGACCRAQQRGTSRSNNWRGGVCLNCGTRIRRQDNIKRHLETGACDRARWKKPASTRTSSKKDSEGLPAD